MAKPNRKKRKSAHRRSAGGSAIPPLAVARQNRPRPDRDKLVGLTIASLVAGLLLVINADRVAHANRVTARGASQHGWPWVFLKRELAEVPDLFISGRTYSWPYPPVAGEVRELSYQNLGLDLLVVGVITIAVYVGVKTIVSRYDRWRYGSRIPDKML